MSVESEVLSIIKPTEADVTRVTETAERLGQKVRDYLASHNIEIKIKFMGSFAKGTYLADPDLDLFMLFPESVSRQDLERIGLKVGEDILHGVKMYSEHPYTKGVFEGLDVDLVPSYALETTEKLHTAVDRTPFHTDYILSHMDDKMRDEVRLMKMFMKGIGTYGAEPNTRGFSGYLCELLVLHYGSFIGVLEGAMSWKEGTVIVIEKKGPPIIGALIVYDPVDQRRNVASAVHLDTLSLFIIAAKAYLANPSKKFFFPEERAPLSKKELEDKAELHGSRIITVVFKKPDIIEDNLYSQLWKTEYALIRKLDDFDFNVLRSVHDMNDKTLEIAFELERDVLSKTYRHVGPPVWVKSAESFMSKWKDNEYGQPFIDEGSWCVIAERMYFTAHEMLTDEAAIAGIGRELDPNTMRIRDHKTSMEETNASLLTELMDPKETWEV